MAPIGHLKVESCNRCVYRRNHATGYPCNRCYTKNANCIEQWFKDENATSKPLLAQPLNDLDLLTMQNDELQVEVASLTRAHRKLRQEFDKLLRELHGVIAREHDRRDREQSRYRDMEFFNQFTNHKSL